MARTLGYLFALLGAIALAATVWWLQHGPPPPREAAARPDYVLPVTLAEVQRGQVAPTVSLIGTVRSPARARAAFEVDGLLESLEVREADTVRAGQVLARLRAREQELAVEFALADRVLYERQLDKLRAGTRAEEKRRLEAERDALLAEERLAEVEVKRGRKLVADNVVSEADLDRRLATHAALTARARAAQEKLSEALAGTRQEDIAIAEAQLAVADAKLEQAREGLAKTQLTSPSDGVVLSRFASVGDYLNAGAPVLEMVDLTALEVQVEIPFRYAARLPEAAPVVLTLDEREGFELHTQLDAKVPAADEKSRNFRGLIRLTPEQAQAGSLEPGVFVRVRIGLAPTDGLVVPADAVRTVDDGQMLVTARSEGDPPALTAAWVPVRVLAVDGDRCAVESLGQALEAGDQVVVIGVDLAFPGVPLLPRPVPGAEADPDGAAADSEGGTAPAAGDE